MRRKKMAVRREKVQWTIRRQGRGRSVVFLCLRGGGLSARGGRVKEKDEGIIRGSDKKNAIVKTYW